MAARSNRTRPRPRGLLTALVLSAALAACEDEPTELDLLPVTSGTISGIPFTVTDGTVYQAGADGPLRADATGGRIVFDEGPLGLGMSDPDLLHVRTFFAISNGGSLRISAFGDAGAELDTGVSILLGRLPDLGFVYELRFGGALVADSTLDPQPQFAGAEHWVVTELYADSVPGAVAGQAGAALWPINDLTPAPSEDVLGCGSEPATDSSPLAGDAVGYVLDNAWLLGVEVLDQVVGPCS